MKAKQGMNKEVWMIFVLNKNKEVIYFALKNGLCFT